MDFLQREAEYKRLVMQKELAKIRLRKKLDANSKKKKGKRIFPVSKYKNPILDMKPKLSPKVEPSEMKPLHVDSILIWILHPVNPQMAWL